MAARESWEPISPDLGCLQEKQEKQFCLTQRNQIKIGGKEGVVREEPVTNESDRALDFILNTSESEPVKKDSLKGMR